MGASRLQLLAEMPKRERQRLLARLSPAELEPIASRYWEIIARSEQLPPPGDWVHWWIIAGRGFGKTRSGSEFIHHRVRTGKMRHGAVVGPTAGDVRDFMIEGETGILPMTRRGEPLPNYEPSKKRVTFANGAVASIYSADEPDRLRGPQHDTAWCDEPATWRYGVASRENLLLGLRVREPRAMWTTTPKPVTLVREAVTEATTQAKAVAESGGFWLDQPEELGGRQFFTAPMTVVSGGTTYDNIENLSPVFRTEIIRRYEGTRLGRQELHAELLEDLGTYFMRGWFSYVEHDQAGRLALPSGMQVVRFWDLAGSVESEANPDPDWTAGVKVGKVPGTDQHIIFDARRVRRLPGGVEQTVAQTAAEDGKDVRIAIEQEPGQSGKAQIGHYKTHVVPGYLVTGWPSTGSKEIRAQVPAGYAEQGKVRIVRGNWNAVYLDELQDFPLGTHDDQVDATSGAFEMLLGAAPAEIAGHKITEARQPALAASRYGR